MDLKRVAKKGPRARKPNATKKEFGVWCLIIRGQRKGKQRGGSGLSPCGLQGESLSSLSGVTSADCGE